MPFLLTDILVTPATALAPLVKPVNVKSVILPILILLSEVPEPKATPVVPYPETLFGLASAVEL